MNLSIETNLVSKEVNLMGTIRDKNGVPVKDEKEIDRVRATRKTSKMSYRFALVSVENHSFSPKTNTFFS